MSVSVQTEDFDVGKEYKELSEGNATDGAIVFFVGQVRDFNDNSDVTGLYLEHYPQMTEKSLEDIVAQAKAKWPLGRVRIVHRVGQLAIGDQIVFVGVTSMHRQAAFEAAEFMMDYLKTKAPFWKKETTAEGQRWVEARMSDHDKAKQWE